MEAIQHVKSIARREWSAYFNSPIAYVFIVIFLLLSGFFTFSISRFYEAGQADLDAFFIWLPWLFLILVPAASMRLWAEERRSGTIEMLFTLSITPAQAIIGKFIAAWLFLILSLLLTFPIVLTAVYLGSPDIGQIIGGYIGGILLAGSFLTVGIFTSALTRNQVISFVLAVVLGLFLVLAGFSPVTEMFSHWAPLWLVDGLASFSVMPHYAALERGVLDLRDVIYFAGVIFFALFCTYVILKNNVSGR